ncbi:MAG TPA: DUF2905 domain-containing protein [Nitrospiraceae bacterium]|nr:DUF2905 domain-containing protein [Nitrospiraceae bacterium]
MTEWESLGRILIAIGLAVATVGVLIVFSDRFPSLGALFGWLGKLPGDVSIKRDQFSFHFPIVTSLVLSAVLSLVFYLVSWLFRR